MRKAGVAVLLQAIVLLHAAPAGIASVWAVYTPSYQISFNVLSLEMKHPWYDPAPRLLNFAVMPALDRTTVPGVVSVIAS